jgi:colanic acid/amylovoran biosynthesis glycosyltransferase
VGGRWPVETFIALRLKGLAQRGFTVRVATNRGTPSQNSQRLEGVQWKPLPVWSGSPLRIIWDLIRMLLSGFARAPLRTWRILHLPVPPKMSRLSNAHMLLPLATEQADLLHFEWNMAAVWYLPLVDLLGCPMIVSCRGSQVHIAPHNPSRTSETSALPKTFQKAAAIHCVSQAISREVVTMGADSAKVHVITPAVDPETFQPARQRRTNVTEFRIVMTGSIIWSKGYDYALEALRILRDRGMDAAITIVGSADKSNRQRLLYAIDDLNLGTSVRIRGTLTPTEVVQELQKSDALLLSSLSEGISNAVLEAMSCALPVVSSACPGMEEAIEHGVTGLLVPLRDPTAIADALESLARDPELRERMGRAARERILREFQISQQIDKWIGLYSALHPSGAAASC